MQSNPEQIGREIMGVDFESFQNVLKHPLRRKIILALSESQNLSYMNLMTIVEARNTGKFNYHLKILADLIQKDENGKYGLTEKGHLAAQFLKTFKEKKAEPSPLRMADALLIGFTGFTLTLGNPFFWTFMSAVSVNLKSIPVFYTLFLLSGIFSLIILALWCGCWQLDGVTHDSYDLYKAPFLAFAMLLLLLVIMLIFHITIGAQPRIHVGQTVSSGNISIPGGGTSSWSRSSYIVFPIGLSELVVSGLIFSFVGVAVSELASRVRKKMLER